MLPDSSRCCGVTTVSERPLASTAFVISRASATLAVLRPGPTGVFVRGCTPGVDPARCFERGQPGRTASLALGNVMSDFYRCRSLAEVFDIYGICSPRPGPGNVHRYYLDLGTAVSIRRPILQTSALSTSSATGDAFRTLPWLARPRLSGGQPLRGFERAEGTLNCCSSSTTIP